MQPSDDTATNASTRGKELNVHSFLECLTGPSRGAIHWLAGEHLVASVGDDRLLHVRSADDAPQQEDIATLTWSGEGYEIEATTEREIWVNGRKVGSVSLLHGDMIEFGAQGPMSRYRLCGKSFPARRAVEDILGDAIAYARASRRPLPGKVSNALRDSGRRLVSETTLFFRFNVMIALAALGVGGYLLYQNDRSLQEHLAQETRRIEAMAVTLAQTREEALTPEDVAALQSSLEAQLSRNAERLGQLEERSDAPARVITASTRSVGFVQGAYGLRQIESGKVLRHMIGPDGQRLQTPFGQPWIEPDGTGAAAEFQFSGTGFLLKDAPYLVTNRHVALPWTSGTMRETFEAAGLAPEMLRLHVYLPGRPDALEARLHNASDTVDLAVLSIPDQALEDRGLLLARDVPRAGEELYLLGYPTGLRALIAQAGPEFLKTLEGEEVDFWTVAERLAQRDLIRPLASRGIVAQISPGAVVYDAETTVGGSGGPALNREGQVVAINAAILPEFGGSNIGVPVAHLRALLEAAPTQ